MNVIELLNTMSFFKLMGQYERQLEKESTWQGSSKTLRPLCVFTVV
jgi:hypothetical protein